MEATEGDGGLDVGPAALTTWYGDELATVALAHHADGSGSRSAVVASADEVTVGSSFDSGWTTYPTGLVRFDDAYWAFGTQRADPDDGSIGPTWLRSADGLTWQPVAADGFGERVLITAAAARDETIVAVGTGVPADAAGAYDTAGIWHSSDGRTWERGSAPQEAGLFPVGVVATEDRFVAVTSGAAVWESVDGRDWEPVDGPATSGTDGAYVSAVDEVVLVGYPDRMWRSTAPGDWQEVSGPAAGSLLQLASAGGHFLAAVRIDESDVDDAICYADPGACVHGASLLASDDGLEWERLDTSGVDWVDDVPRQLGVTTPGGGFAIVENDGGLAIWRGDRALPVLVPLPDSALVAIPDSGPETGTQYAVRATLSCGAEWLSLHGAPEDWAEDAGYWVRRDGGSGVAENWPVVTVGHYDGYIGWAVFTGPDTLDLVAEDGTRLAVYERSEEPAPPCD